MRERPLFVNVVPSICEVIDALVFGVRVLADKIEPFGVFAGDLN